MAVKTRAALKSENATDFPDNSTQLISPAKLRGQMDDVADSARLLEDIPKMFDAGSALYPSIKIGQNALGVLGTADSIAYNIAIGHHAGQALAASTGSIAIGGEALSVATSGDVNIAIGMYSQWSVNGGRANLAVGNQSMMLNVGGSDNTAIGHFSLQLSGGYSNTALGKHTMDGLGTGDYNVAVGDDAGRLSIEEGSGNILLGKSADTSGPIANNQIAIGTYAKCLGDNICTIGMSTNCVSISLDGATTSWVAASDERLKTDIEDYQVGLSFIEALRPVTYAWRAKKDVPPELPGYEDGSNEPCRGFGKRYVGFVAQEVKAIIDAQPGVPDGQHLWTEWGGVQGIAQAELIPILVNAIQELAAEVASLKSNLQR